MQKPVLVIKLGTAVLANGEGVISRRVVQKVAEGIATLSGRYRIILVSSGAVGSGKAYIRNYRGTITERKAAAAIGNPLLIKLYQKYFDKYDIPVAQALCERHHFSSRPQFLQLKETFAEFWHNGILPIVNENDLVSNIELKFSDNDELATLLAISFDAQTLVVCTSAGGFLDDENQVIPQVDKIDQKIMSLVKTDKSALGLGGMASKLTFTRLATSLGIRVIIAGLKGEEPFIAAMKGQNGTVFSPQASNLKARQKWLASGSITLGSITVDKGAARALAQRNSLLTVGVTKVRGRFTAGEVVQLMDEAELILGVAKVKLGAAAILDNVAVKHVLAAHADDIVLF